MRAIPAEAIEAASRRLRGQLVAVPLIGELRLPGFAVPGDLRLAPELLQPGGSLAYRGALHFLMRQLGSLKGVVLHGPPARLLSLALAAATQRLPMLVLTEAEPAPALAGPLQQLGCELAVATDVSAEARRRGFAVLGDAAEPDFAVGVATLGRELAASLPADTATLFVPAPFAGAIAAGLATARERIPEVVEVAAGPVPAGLAAALLQGHRLGAGDAALATLAAALAVAAGPTLAVVLSD